MVQLAQCIIALVFQGTVANSYTTYITYNAICTTILRANFISITLNTADRLCFTDHTGTNSDVQIPANRLYSPANFYMHI